MAKKEVLAGSQLWEEIDSSNIGRTGGLEPCLGIAVYNPETKIAYISHHVAPELTLKKAIENLKEKYDINLKKVKVYAAGCSPMSTGIEYEGKQVEDYRTSIIRRQEHVLRLLNNYFDKKQLSIQFLSENSIGELFFDAGKKEAYLETEETRADKKGQLITVKKETIPLERAKSGLENKIIVSTFLINIILLAILFFNNINGFVISNNENKNINFISLLFPVILMAFLFMLYKISKKR